MTSTFSNWISHREITFSADGKHVVLFDPAFPLILKSYSFSPAYRLTPGYHEYLEIMHIFRGRGRLTVESREYELRQGDTAVINNTEFHVVEALFGEPLDVLCIFFLRDYIAPPGAPSSDFNFLTPFFDRPAGFSTIVPAAADPDSTVLNAIRDIHSYLAGLEPLRFLSTKIRLCEILLFLCRHYQNTGSRKNRHSAERADIERLQPVFSYIQQNYANNISNEQLGRIACMSPNYLCRFFRRITGTTISTYIMRYRIDKAKELLAGSRFSVARIGADTGFGCHAYFDRVFYRLVHMTPGQFRKTYGIPR